MANLPYPIGTGTLVSNNTFLTKLGADLEGLAYGVTNGSEATTGTIGEYQIVKLDQTTPIVLTTASDAQVLVMTLQPGDWDLTGELIVGGGGGTATVTNILGAIDTVVTTTPAVIPSDGTDICRLRGVSASTRQALQMHTRANITAATAYYLVAQAVFTGSNCPAYGVLRARRMR